MGALIDKNVKPSTACRPFDKAHQGFVFGQASASMILESATLNRQQNPQGRIKLMGAASCLDGNRSSNPSLDGKYE